jgi:1-acyl-sn-glycerol-3-phosphate acyltransferase
MERILSSLIAGLAWLVTGASARWVENGPSENQRIYFANHSSHLDTLVVWAALPPNIRRKTRPVAAKDYWERNVLMRYLALRVFKAVLIQRPSAEGAGPRSALRALEEMAKALDEGYSLILFPEGGRMEGGEAAPFKAGLYHLAKDRPKIELVPAYLENLNRILPKGEFLAVPLLGSLTFGSPLTLLDDEPKKDFLDRARKSLEGLRS